MSGGGGAGGGNDVVQPATPLYGDSDSAFPGITPNMPVRRTEVVACITPACQIQGVDSSLVVCMSTDCQYTAPLLYAD
jgi:hypothetical protein